MKSESMGGGRLQTLLAVWEKTGSRRVKEEIRERVGERGGEEEIVRIIEGGIESESSPLSVSPLHKSIALSLISLLTLMFQEQQSESGSESLVRDTMPHYPSFFPLKRRREEEEERGEEKVLEALERLMSHSSVELGGRVRGTRLTVAASNLFVYITRSLSLSLLLFPPNSPISNSQLVRQLRHTLPIIQKYLVLLTKWYKGVRRVYCRGLNTILLQLTQALSNPLISSQQLSLEEKIFWIGWAEYSTHILETPHNHPLHTLTQLLTILKEGGQSERTNALVCMSLILGKLKKKKATKVVRKLQEEQELLSVLMSMFNLPLTSHFHQLSSQLLRKILSILKSNELIVTDALQQLYALLEQNPDVPSPPIIALLADLLTDSPELLVDVFTKLGSGDKQKRVLALKLIQQLSDIDQNSFNQNPQLCKILGHHLLNHLHDPDLNIQIAASKLFKFLDVSQVIGTLCSLTKNKDPNLRSAASTALVDLFLTHPDVVHVTKSLLFYLSEKEESVPINPSHIGPPKLISVSYQELQAQVIDRVMDIVPKWAENIRAEDWIKIIKEVIVMIFCHPDSNVLIKFLAKIGKYMGPNLSLFLPTIINKMLETQENERERENKKKEKGEVDESIFSTLAPLLILRVIPYSFFTKLKAASLSNPQQKYSEVATVQYKQAERTDNEVNGSGIKGKERETKKSGNNTTTVLQGPPILLLNQMLLQRMLDITEYQEVRKISAELRGYIGVDDEIQKFLKSM
eukprot:CAMPEP_0174254940 /NCGR_PEP_ID=MMETSP0439-20130205/4280_1 /TAXON_ID=0 /ORGANISM="Stereomyxa ramosa, Strain Chinc5" /LENGTH=745 /DNA_ID=CAMNT_0015336847 /DNA_START=62 /DNA_END=2300 /DNA_ORIENTATION=+